MSKSCVDICEIIDPMTFLQLDILTNGLICETYSLHHEFLTKIDFLKDWQYQLIENESQIYKIDTFLKSLQLNMAATEEQIEQLECDLKKCNKIVGNMDMPIGYKCNYCSRRRSEQEQFLELIQNTDFKMAQLYNFPSDVEAILKYFGLQPRPYGIIFRILNCQNQILSNTDKNLDLILDKLLIISSMLRRHENVGLPPSA